MLKLSLKSICGEVIDVRYAGALVPIDLTGGILLSALYSNVLLLCRSDEYRIGARKTILTASYKFPRNDSPMSGLLIFLLASDAF